MKTKYKLLFILSLSYATTLILYMIYPLEIHVVFKGFLILTFAVCIMLYALQDLIHHTKYMTNREKYDNLPEKDNSNA